MRFPPGSCRQQSRSPRTSDWAPQVFPCRACLRLPTGLPHVYTGWESSFSLSAMVWQGLRSSWNGIDNNQGILAGGCHPWSSSCAFLVGQRLLLRCGTGTRELLSLPNRKESPSPGLGMGSPGPPEAGTPKPSQEDSAGTPELQKGNILKPRADVTLHSSAEMGLSPRLEANPDWS